MTHRRPGPVLRAVSGAAGVGRVVLAVPTGYLAVLTASAWAATLAGRSRPRQVEPSHTFAVLVPAHDEELVIGDALRALTGVDYPAERWSLHVLADHCTDRTADIARAAGATVHELHGEVRGKGPALATAIDELGGADATRPDAFVVVDADTVVDRAFLRQLDAAFAAGAPVVQGQYRVREPGGSAGAGMRAAALALRHHLRPLGRTALGGSCGLYGNGMAFRADVVVGRDWSNHLTEDLELQTELLLDDVVVAYAPAAVVEAEMPATLEGATTQNERWERGRIELARRYLPRLLGEVARRRGRRRVAVADTALDYVVPPLSVLVAGVTAVAAVEVVVAAVGRTGRWRRALVLPAMLVVHVVSGLVLGRAPWSVYRSLLHAPAMVAWKVRLWLRMVRPGAAVSWRRTGQRGGRGVSERTAVVLGAPIDDVTLDEAVDRVMEMVERGRATGRVHQVATVNVDFVVNAAEDDDLLAILRRTDLAIPDGMPLVWASRLLGTPLRQRTTGIDLLPALAERAAGDGRRLLLYGAAPGVAERAAALLRERYGGDVVGREAPPVPADAATDDTELAALRSVDADIVGVALGNPKQERWIARHGRAVGAPVFIGIGGSLDFLTGVTQRAPGWMQDHGLEWLHRAVSEPLRLPRRYARDFRVFGPALAAQLWRGRRREEAIVPAVAVGSAVAVALHGALPDAGIEPAVAGELRAAGSVSVDLSALRRADNVTLSALAGLLRESRRWGAATSVAGPPDLVDVVERIGGISPGTRGFGGTLPARGGE